MPTTTIAPWPVVARPMEGPAVQALQHLLRHHGQTIAADGIFGPKTDAAVRDMQRHFGIAVDGIVGPVTWRALVNNGC